MNRKRIAIMLVMGIVIATMLVLSLNIPAQAQSYGATAGVSSGTGTPGTGAELALFALAGAALVGAGYFLTRKSKA
ncbi:hypothetical protein BMS3Abin01_01262 [bacterium BMS3Abin01]|nr:hypothetical protein BMS3Abin01_01262 [bacterium BMS3Abin01]